MCFNFCHKLQYFDDMIYDQKVYVERAMDGEHRRIKTSEKRFGKPRTNENEKYNNNSRTTIPVE